MIFGILPVFRHHVFPKYLFFIFDSIFQFLFNLIKIKSIFHLFLHHFSHSEKEPYFFIKFQRFLDIISSIFLLLFISFIQILHISNCPLSKHLFFPFLSEISSHQKNIKNIFSKNQNQIKRNQISNSRLQNNNSY
jgi:hypothetical protein